MQLKRVVTTRMVDAVIVLACLALTALAVKAPWSPLPRPLIAVAGTIGSLAQWQRRRWPQSAAAAGAVALVCTGNVLPWLVGLYSAAARVSRRRLWIPGAVAFAGFVAWTWIDAGELPFDVLAAGAVTVALVLMVGAYLATRDALMSALQARAEHAAAEQALRDEQARAAERTRIAREMHDVLAHKVSLIALHAGALELRAGDDVRLREGTALIRTTAREALQELREVLGVLRTGTGAREVESTVDLAGLVQASVAAGQVVQLRDSASPLPAATARVVYRIVQEGLTNARKHAPGARTTVLVSQADVASVTVTVRNELGAAPAQDVPGSGSGLIGLAERIRLVGGSLRSGPTRDGAAEWELCAVVPLLGPTPSISDPIEVDAP